jgi:hypothetical protein
VQAELQARQPYRFAYQSAIYRGNRRRALKRAGGRCERMIGDLRCPMPATEVNHRVPLSAAGRDRVAALALCELANLEAVCHDHNPRGQAVA